MDKTQKILKRFISLILTFAISFGSYVFPVFAALPEDNEAPTIEELVDAYQVLKTKGQEVNTKIGGINATNPAQDSPKAKAVIEVESYLNELNSVFNNNASDPIEHETLVVKTTKFNVITVLVDFKLSDLGITLTNETMHKQVLTDTYSMLQEYYYQLELMLDYLEKTDNYTNAINIAGEKLDEVSKYIEKLEKLEINYDRDLYEGFALELAKLMIVEVTDEDIDSVNKLSDDLVEYSKSITTILKTNLLEKYKELDTLATTNIAIPGVDIVKTNTGNAITALETTDTYDLLVLSDEYINNYNNYNTAILENEKNERPEEYIDSKIDEVNDLISETFGLNITVEQIDTINTLVEPNILNGELTMELLVKLMDQDELSEKLISEELSYEVLEAFVELYNNHREALDEINNLNSDLGSQYSTNIVDAVENDIFGENGGYIEELESIENTSKTDEERLEILNKLDLIEFSVMVFGSNFFPSSDDEAITPITEEIEKLKEFYNKSCDNTLTNLTINGIEMDVLEETYKVYVGNDVTEIKVLFEQAHENAKVEVLNAKDLKVGTNEVIVVVTAENGEIRQYVIEVIRAEAKAVVTTTENKTDDEVKTITLNNSVVEEVEPEDEHKNTSDSNEKYNEEVEEEGLSALTVLLIVIGIGLVGYGIYKIFGDKEDQKIDKAFGTSKKTPNKTSKNKSKKRK